jgi:CRP-like cAMP-binding protein
MTNLISQGAPVLHTLHSECNADCELADAIEALSNLRRVPAKHILFRQGQPPSRLFLLKAGGVVLTSKRADKSVMGFRAGPGSLIGLPAIAGSRPYSMTAVVTKNSDLHAISISMFREIVGSNPRLSFRVLEILAAEVRSARLLVSTALSSVTRHSRTAGAENERV